MVGTFSKPVLLLRRQAGGSGLARQNQNLDGEPRKEHGETAWVLGCCCRVLEMQHSTPACLLPPSLTSPSAPISGWLRVPPPSSLPPRAAHLEGSGHPRRDAEVPEHRGVSPAGDGDIASSLPNQLSAWVGEGGHPWGPGQGTWVEASVEMLLDVQG